MSVLATLGAAALNNAMSELHADRSDARARALMDKQNAMNQANALSAYTNQVQGMRMAGLNPALAQGLGNAPVQSVSPTQGAKAENVEVSPQDLLVQAQIENINADTRKKESEVKNVDEDTDLKFAQKLFTGANQSKVEEETTNIRNLNDAFAAENRNLGKFGKAMAQKWKNSEWFDSLAPDTKDTINSIADGSVPLSVGAMRALNSAIQSQKNLSDADAALVRNAFSNAVVESQFNNDDVFDAIVKEPKVRNSLTEAQTSKLKAEIDRISYEYKKVIDSEIAHVKAQTSEAKARAALEAAETKLRNLDFKRLNLDPDVRRYEGDVKGYLGSMAQKALDAAINAAPSVAGSYLTGRIAGKAAGNAAGNAAGHAVDKAAEYGRQYKAGQDYGNKVPPYMYHSLGEQMRNMYNQTKGMSLGGSSPFPRQ